MSPLRALARTAIRRPGVVLTLLGAASAAMVPGLLRLEIRTDGAAIYPDGDPAVVRTQEDRKAFGEPDQIILLATSRPGGPPLASPAGFRFLAALQNKLARMPGVEPLGVRSLASLVAPPEGRMERLTIETFADLWSRGKAGDEGLPALLARIRRLPVANGLFLSADGKAAPFYISISPAARNAGRAEALAALEQIAAAHRGEPFDLRVMGPVAAEVELGRAVLRDLGRLVPVMVLAVALLLAVTLRTAGGVIVPLAQVLATLLWTLGLMGWCGIPITLVTTVMPVLLMAMAMTDEIYLIERLRDHLATTAAAGPERVRTALAAAFDDLWAPLALISLSTAAGFFSFATASMPPLRHFGVFTGLGLLFGMLFTFTLAPALVAVLPARWVERRERGSPALLGYERWTARRPRAMALAGAALVALAIPGLFRLRIEDSWIDNLDPRSPLATAERIFNRNFWGSYRYDVVVQGDPGLFARPAGVAVLEELHRFARTAPHVGGAWSPLPPFEAAARALGDPLPVSALPPADLKRVAALTEVLRLRLGLGQILSLQADAARVRLFVRNADYRKARELERAVRVELMRLPASVSAHVSGDVPVALAVVGSVVGNQLRSIAGTAILIALMLLAAFRSLRLAAAVLAPVLAATLLVFAAMGYAGRPLGIATSMFAALTLGAGVDFAVQYTYAYLRERRASRPHDEAVEETLRTTGRGLRWNAVVLALGIAVLAVSAIHPNASLGVLLAAAMAVSYAATLTFLPELLRRLAVTAPSRRSP